MSDWAARYRASLPTSPHKPGDPAEFLFAGCCSTGWHRKSQTIVVTEGDVIDGKVVRKASVDT